MKDMSRSSKSTQIKFNQGQALLHLAGMYPTLLEVILELVQNALDKDVNATRIWIHINYQARYLAVRDNGAGVSVDRFNQALASVATPGRKGEGSLGQFGIGLISPLGKCERFTFISCPAPQKYGFQEWTFETQRIVNQRDCLSIPLRARPDMTLDDSVRGKQNVKWRSEMGLHKFTTDEYISRVPIDTLIGGIQDRYATVMRRNKVVVSIVITDPDGKKEERPNVTAVQFRGRKLTEREVDNRDAGKTTFRLFIAPKSMKKGGGRNGRVQVGVAGNDFRFPFHYFARSAVDLLKEEVITSLSSGLFEGEILSEHAKLHPSRRTFEKDDAFIGFCCAIEEWFNLYGSLHLEEARQSRQEERFQELGLRSMRVLEQLLHDPAHASLLGVIKSFSRGTIGIGHAEVPGRVMGEQDQKALSVDGKPGVARSSNPDTSRDEREKPKDPKPEHTPLTVVGPKGQQRKVVRSDSFGLQFSHEAMEGSPDLWKLDTQNGVLRFNIRHPLWIACDEKSDLVLMKLQEYVTIQALTLQVMPENGRVPQRQVLDEVNHSFVSWLIRSDRARGTIPANKKSPNGKKSKK
jgi:hypothetical protein